jgi:rfaE bifunctional protein nucleotidyltransferase chain/domain
MLSQKEIDITENFESKTGPRVDYTNVMCEKPWGYEFLAYESTRIGVWCLTVKKGHSTSLHCHFKKDTFIVVLKGCARIELIDGVHVLGVLESMYIQKRKFHALGSFAPETVILEIEIFGEASFSDKNDLLRIDDQYKRKPIGYESSIQTTQRDERCFWLSDDFDSIIHDVNIQVGKKPMDSSQYSLLLKGEFYNDGIFLKEGSLVKNFTEGDCLFLNIHKNDWKEDCKIIYDMEQLAIVSKNKKIALTSGCFDILHVGHLRNLKKARSLADHLFVCLSSDEQIKKIKGDNRPINNYEDRINLFKSVPYVDHVILYYEVNTETEETLGTIMKVVDPYCWVKGDDYNKSQILEKHPYLKKIHIVPNIPLKSTTTIIKKCQL